MMSCPIAPQAMVRLSNNMPVRFICVSSVPPVAAYPF
jgi:hypothetical protein